MDRQTDILMDGEVNKQMDASTVALLLTDGITNGCID